MLTLLRILLTPLGIALAGLAILAAGLHIIHNKNTAHVPERSELTPVTGVIKDVVKRWPEAKPDHIIYDYTIEPSRDSPITNIRAILSPEDLKDVKADPAKNAKFETTPGSYVMSTYGMALDEAPRDRQALSLVGMHVTALVKRSRKRQTEIWGTSIWELSAGNYLLIDYAKSREKYVQTQTGGAYGPITAAAGGILSVCGMIWFAAAAVSLRGRRR